MKDDEKKAPKEDMQFSDEEDMDFEILDALAQLGQSGPKQDAEISDDTIELTLDDEDIAFGESASEAGSGFSFDESLKEDLEQELLQGDSGFDIDESLEKDLVKEIQGEAGKASFALDLDLDEEFSDEGFETDDESPAFDMSAAETLAFDYNVQESEAKMRSLDDESLDDLGSYDLDLGGESDELDLESFSSQEDDFPELDLGIEGVEISKEFADLGADIDLESPDDLPEKEEEIRGKGVIAVGDDEVIDLGDENQLLEEPLQDKPEAEPISEMPEETAIPSPADIDLDLHEEDDEELMSSIEDIELDLKRETDAEAAEFGSAAEEEDAADFPVGVEEENAESLMEEEGPEPESTDIASLVSEVLEAQDAEKTEEKLESPEVEGQPEEPVKPASAEVEAEEEEKEEEELNVREFLGLSLRLSDEQIEEFEAMVNEAKTLQTYLDELEDHHPDVKEKIFQKLQVEYVARKTVIFKSEAFTSLLSDVVQDLEDMLAKRTDFVETVDRLNEELEEIKVRHLVGEYDDATLSEKQESQNAEIALWNEKTEKIELFITRYQESLEAEKVLNPLRHEQAESADEEELPQEAETAVAEEPLEAAEIPATEPTEEEGEDTFAVEEEAEEDTIEEESLPAAEEIGEESADELLEAETLEETEAPAEEEELSGESDIEDFFAGSDEGLEEGDELDEEFPIAGDFETGDFVLDDLTGFEDDEEEEEEEDVSELYEVLEEAASEEEAMVECSKCGRQTPAAEKFCIHCGGKAQKAEQEANVSCKKCGRQTPAAEKFCIHCGGKAQ